ncbi:hypothetical protein [Plantactinospora endophytica]|uniref:Uncharacterized protein n=1 Tax=Plantactinospora endophytica TaxID=673535 RepID=A0ABQ4E1P7_9ACTN|nr:hypothetical protein [Plantactinospora endophytica]GIG88590.1 hypothetical protein Pen02_35260 [Plantactinospora endophytica]
MKRRNRWFGLAGAAVTVVAAQAGIQLVDTAPAAAVTGIERTSELSATDSRTARTVRAFCPVGTWVIGGGGWAFAVAAADSAKVALVQLVPEHRTDGTRDSFLVTGTETTTAMTGNWWLEAYAICASPSGLAGYQVVGTQNQATSSPVEAAASAGCGTRRALGGGAEIVNSGGQVALHVARASASGDIFRGAAHEDADGYSGNWTVNAYAVCVNTPAGYTVVTEPSAQSDSEAEKFALANCPSGTRVHGAGAAISDTAPGGVALQVAYPSSLLGYVQAFAVENTPVGQDWDFIVAQAICAA